jgi:hypothetical protein
MNALMWQEFLKVCSTCWTQWMYAYLGGVANLAETYILCLLRLPVNTRLKNGEQSRKIVWTIIWMLMDVNILTSFRNADDENLRLFTSRSFSTAQSPTEHFRFWLALFLTGKVPSSILWTEDEYRDCSLWWIFSLPRRTLPKIFINRSRNPLYALFTIILPFNFLLLIPNKKPSLRTP